jgi:hypothetical protein
MTALGWSGPLVGATFLGGLGGAMARSEHPYPRPGATHDEIARYFAQDAVWISVTGQLLSATSLTVWTGAVARLACRRRPLRAAAITGGALSTAALGASAACTAALAARPEPSARSVRLHRAAFLAGGPTHGVGFGLLLGALGLTGRSTGRLSGRLANAALVAAVPNLVSPTYLVWPSAAWSIPAGRFPGLVITAVAGVQMASTP